jgi:hypothetical protein
VRRHGSLRVAVGVKAVSRIREPLDDHLDVVTCPPGHLVADKLCLFEQTGIPDRATELAQLVPDTIALPHAVAVKPVRRRHHADDTEASGA